MYGTYAYTCALPSWTVARIFFLISWHDCVRASVCLALFVRTSLVHGYVRQIWHWDNNTAGDYTNVQTRSKNFVIFAEICAGFEFHLRSRNFRCALRNTEVLHQPKLFGYWRNRDTIRPDYKNTYSEFDSSQKVKYTIEYQKFSTSPRKVRHVRLENENR